MSRQLEKVIDARFSRIEGGYQYHPWNWAKGYLVTEEEYQRVRAEYLSATGWRLMLAAFGYLLFLSVLVAIFDVGFGGKVDDYPWLQYLLIAPILLAMLCRMFAPQRLVWGRTPITLKRTKEQLRDHEARQSGWFLIVVAILLSTGFTAAGIFAAFRTPLIGIPVALLFAWALLRNLHVGMRKWQLTAES